MKKILLVFVCTLLVLLLSIRPSETWGTASAGEISATESKPIAADRITRVLVMGRDRAAGLTDSMMVVTLNETAKQASILQIPRDTYANYTDRDYKKLNGACSCMGADGVKQMLARAFGVPIHYYLVLDLDCLQSMVDAIGGVDVVLPQAMEYNDPAQGLVIRLPAGAVHLDGEKAEQMVRYRSGYVNADLGRLDAQKLFLQAVAVKCKTLSAAQVLRVAELALTKVQTDITLPDIIRITAALRACETDHLPMATLAGEAVQGVSGAWYYVLNRAAACRMVNEYLLPDRMLSIEEFDAEGLFDRIQTSKFHEIYIAPDPHAG